MKARHYGHAAVAFVCVMLTVLGVRVASGSPEAHQVTVDSSVAYSGPHLGFGLASAAAAQSGKEQLRNIQILKNAIWKAAVDRHNYARWLEYWHQRLYVPPRAPPKVVRHITAPPHRIAPQVYTAPPVAPVVAPVVIAPTGGSLCGWDDRTCWRSVGQTVSQINGNPCGGSLPSCCTLRFESGGNPSAQNPGSSASGLWQFLDGTWGGYGGYSKARYAPASVQNDRARQVFAGGAGASNWYGDGCFGGR